MLPCVCGGLEQVKELPEKWSQLQTSEEGPSSQDAFRSCSVLKKRRIVLLALPGAGKSSSGNTILGDERFRSSCNLNSVTAGCAAGSVTMEGRKVTVVAAPGFCDGVIPAESVFEELQKMIKMVGPGPHAFILVVKLDRLSGVESVWWQQCLKILSGAFHSWQQAEWRVPEQFYPVQWPCF